MIKTNVTKYYDNEFMSVELEKDGIVFANVNIEANELKLDIYKISENFSLNLQELTATLQYAKDELLKIYPEFDKSKT
jgi:hypothetical protein